MVNLKRFAPSLVLFGIGLVLGGWLSTILRGTGSPSATGQRVKATTANGQTGLFANPQFTAEEDMLTKLMSAVTQEDPLARSFQFREVLYRLTPAQIGICFDRILQMDDRERRNFMLERLIARWVAIDPESAKTKLQPYRDRARAGQIRLNSVERTVNEAWARAFPEETLREAVATPNSPWSRAVAANALAALGGGDIAVQLDVLTRMPPSRLRDELCAGPIEALAEKDFAAAKAQLGLISDPRRRSRTEIKILTKLAERNPAATLDEMVNLSQGMENGIRSAQLMGTVWRKAAELDPAAALAAVDRLPDTLRAQAVGGALVGWADSHPIDALNWAVANGISIREIIALPADSEGEIWQSLTTVAGGADSPQKILDWIRSQPASRERDEMLQDALWRGPWEKRLEIFNELDPASQKDALRGLLTIPRGDSRVAEDWVKSISSGDTKAEAVRLLVIAQAQEKSELIDSAAENWPVGTERDAALSGVCSVVARDDPERAVEIAKRIADPQVRTSTLWEAASSWLQKDEKGARAWLASASGFSADEKRVILRQFEER